MYEYTARTYKIAVHVTYIFVRALFRGGEKKHEKFIHVHTHTLIPVQVRYVIAFRKRHIASRVKEAAVVENSPKAESIGACAPGNVYTLAQGADKILFF